MYICPNCKTVFEDSHVTRFKPFNKNFHIYYCPCKSCNSIVLECDELMIPVIIEAYNAGLFTLFSCSGHSYEKIGCCPYVMFANDISNIIEKVPLPKGFRYSVNTNFKDNRITSDGYSKTDIDFNTCVYANHIERGDKTLMEYQILINNEMNKFYKWFEKVINYLKS